MKKPKKTIKKLKSVKVPTAKLRHPFKPAKSQEQKVSDALSNVPRITNETVTEHREEVLAGARKYIYPLQHSKHRVVRISLALLAGVIIAFFVITGLELYKFQSTSSFTYDVTRIIPFPVAKAGSSWVSYESYLFELRRNMHYYQTQQQANFKTKDGQTQLARLKKQAMAQVVQDAYVKQLAADNGVKVSDQAVKDEVTLVKSENRLGSSDRAFHEVLSEFWGWNEADFKRELKQQLLQQAVVTKLDTGTNAKAQAALKQIQGGADFATVATQVSDDLSTKATGGQYPAAVTYSTRDLPPVITPVIFKLKAGQVSGLVNTGYTVDIVKTIDVSGDSRHAAHIQFTLKPVNTYVQPVQAKHTSHQFIRLQK